MLPGKICTMLQQGESLAEKQTGAEHTVPLLHSTQKVMTVLDVLIEEDGLQARTVRVNRFPCRIGRGKDSEVRLGGWLVARVHAELHRVGTGIKLVDMGTLIGTRVNGERVVEYGPLSERDEILLAGYRLQVQGTALRQATPSASLGLPEQARSRPSSEAVASHDDRRVMHREGFRSHDDGASLTSVDELPHTHEDSSSRIDRSASGSEPSSRRAEIPSHGSEDSPSCRDGMSDGSEAWPDPIDGSIDGSANRSHRDGELPNGHRAQASCDENVAGDYPPAPGGPLHPTNGLHATGLGLPAAESRQWDERMESCRRPEAHVGAERRGAWPGSWQQAGQKPSRHARQETSFRSRHVQHARPELREAGSLRQDARLELEDATPERQDQDAGLKRHGSCFSLQTGGADRSGDENAVDTMRRVQDQLQDQSRLLGWRRIVHRQLLEVMDLRRSNLAHFSNDQLRAEVRGVVEGIVNGLTTLPADVDRDVLMQETVDEAVGLGPLERLMADPLVSEIMVNSATDIFVERCGCLEQVPLAFSDDDAIRNVIERIVAPLGRRIDESSPLVDARLADGSRVNAIIPPVALKGPTITIRRFNRTVMTPDTLVANGSASEAMMAFLAVCVRERKSMIVSGGTGSGKTTLLNVLSNLIPPGERLITIEDAAELKLMHPHLVSLEARPANAEGRGAVTIRDLVKNALRMRPDRIIVGECRGAEALDMMQAMNTGHEGSLTTVHANTPRDVLSRLEVLMMMAGLDLPLSALREQVASAVDLIVHQARFSDGSRRITSITEVCGVESGRIQTQEIFRYDQTGRKNARVQGRFRATQQVPSFYETLSDRGVAVDLSIFEDRSGTENEYSKVLP